MDLTNRRARMLIDEKTRWTKGKRERNERGERGGKHDNSITEINTVWNILDNSRDEFCINRQSTNVGLYFQSNNSI